MQLLVKRRRTYCSVPIRVEGSGRREMKRAKKPGATWNEGCRYIASIIADKMWLRKLSSSSGDNEASKGRVYTTITTPKKKKTTVKISIIIGLVKIFFFSKLLVKTGNFLRLPIYFFRCWKPSSLNEQLHFAIIFFHQDHTTSGAQFIFLKRIIFLTTLPSDGSGARVDGKTAPRLENSPPMNFVLYICVPHIDYVNKKKSASKLK